MGDLDLPTIIFCAFIAAVVVMLAMLCRYAAQLESDLDRYCSQVDEQLDLEDEHRRLIEQERRRG